MRFSHLYLKPYTTPRSLSFEVKEFCLVSQVSPSLKRLTQELMIGKCEDLKQLLSQETGYNLNYKPATEKNHPLPRALNDKGLTHIPRLFLQETASAR